MGKESSLVLDRYLFVNSSATPDDDLARTMLAVTSPTHDRVDAGAKGFSRCHIAIVSGLHTAGLVSTETRFSVLGSNMTVFYRLLILCMLCIVPPDFAVILNGMKREVYLCIW